MNVIHRSAISLVAGLLFVTGAFAQDSTTQNTPAQNTPSATAPAGKHHMRRDPVAMRLQMMSQKLNLTDDQKAKIQPILQDQMQQMRAIRKDSSLTPDQQKAKIEELRKNSNGQIKQLLTPEQVALMGKGPHEGARHPQGSPLEWMSKNLNLTDDQKAKLQPVFEDQQKQLQALKQDTSLTPEQKRAKVVEIHKATHQQVIAVLTPDQQKQLKEMRGKQMHKHGTPGNAPQSQPVTPPPSA
jgi:Spy/CpxP family protein refolding chaperone